MKFWYGILWKSGRD